MSNTQVLPRRLLAAAAGVGAAVSGATALEVRRRLTAQEPVLDRRLARDVARRMTTPLLPDDYLTLLNPLWTAREIRGRVVEVRPETEDAATLVIKPGWGWRPAYRPGQYVGIGVNLDGRWHWRSYSISSPPLGGTRWRSSGLLTVTVKAMPEGFLSQHLVRGLAPGTIVRLALPQGDFVLPDPPPARLLFWTGGSGITPVMAMLRTLDRRNTMPDVVHVHVAPSRATSLFREELGALAARHPSLRLVENFTDEHGHFDVQSLARACPDWQEREAWVCGPAPLLDAAARHWERAGQADRLHLERFSVARTASATGGHVRFAISDREVDVDGATTLLEAGEAAGVPMPFGCRMGICHTCVVPLRSGVVKDLRNGNEYQENQGVQTCITAAAGDCILAV